jgi:phosphoribosylglycinamide formyltransferase 1
MKIAVLASHAGTTLQAVLDACARNELAAKVVLVVSNNSQAGALKRAEAAGVKTAHLSSQTHPGEEALDRAILEALLAARADIVLLAGYMKRLGPLTLVGFERRIINTHPALLPKFGGDGMYGANVHRAVLAAGERVSGATVHWVEADYDTGPALAQSEVVVDPADTVDTLAARVQAAERQLLIEVLQRLASGQLPLGVGSAEHSLLFEAQRQK